jgi:hypothetical protein
MRDTASALLPFLLTVVVASSVVYWYKLSLAPDGNFLLFVAVSAAIAYVLLLVCLLLNQSSRAFLGEMAAVVRTALPAGTRRAAGTTAD